MKSYCEDKVAVVTGAGGTLCGARDMVSVAADEDGNTGGR